MDLNISKIIKQCIILFVWPIFYKTQIVSSNYPKLITFNQSSNVSLNDSSLYSFFKINNKFFIAGKNGNVKCLIYDTIDHQIKISNSEFVNFVRSIIKDHTILYTLFNDKTKELFLFTNNGKIFKFYLLTNSYIIHDFNKKNKAIYFAGFLNDSTIIICGGNKKVSKGKISISKGYLDIISTNFKTTKNLWKNTFRFVWHWEKLSDNEIIFTAFNGLNSKICKINLSENKTKKVINIKGLVYQLHSLSSNQILFYGSPTYLYHKNSLIGIIENNKIKLKHTYNNLGCLWSMKVYNNNYYFSSDNGSILWINKDDLNLKKFSNAGIYKTNINLPIYCMYNYKNMLILGYSKNFINILELSQSN